MPIGSTKNGNIRTEAFQQTMGGSVQSDWEVANSAANAVSSSSELLNPASSDDAGVRPIVIPHGCTRILARLRYAISTTTCTTAPTVVFATLDANGVPQRIDNADSDAVGTTLGCASGADPRLAMNDGTYYWSDVVSLTGWDCLGDKTLYTMIKVASNYSGGTPDVQVWVKFLN